MITGGMDYGCYEVEKVEWEETHQRDRERLRRVEQLRQEARRHYARKLWIELGLTLDKMRDELTEGEVNMSANSENPVCVVRERNALRAAIADNRRSAAAWKAAAKKWHAKAIYYRDGRLEAVRDALTDYGSHSSWCAVARLNDMDVSCDCGLDAALGEGE